jgi:dTDP-4-dehydrorhamnose reductase
VPDSKGCILLTGSSGMLGRDIYQALTEEYEVFGTDLVPFKGVPKSHQIIGNLTDSSFIRSTLEVVDPEVIIHCAAIVNLKFCEEEKDLTDRLHLKATSELAEHHSKMVFISTDSVFDGKRGNYVEDDPIHPLNYYGESKWQGEELVRKQNEHLILRTNIFGFSCPLKGSIAEWSIKNIDKGNPISGFIDVYFNSIYTKHLAQIIKRLLELGVTGTLHAASRNALSKYSFLKCLENRLTGQSGLVGKSKSTAFDLFPDRPMNPTLNVDRLSKWVDIPTIEAGIDALVKDYMEVKHECHPAG